MHLIYTLSKILTSCKIVTNFFFPMTKLLVSHVVRKFVKTSCLNQHHALHLKFLINLHRLVTGKAQHTWVAVQGQTHYYPPDIISYFIRPVLQLKLSQETIKYWMVRVALSTVLRPSTHPFSNRILHSNTSIVFFDNSGAPRMTWRSW